MRRARSPGAGNQRIPLRQRWRIFRDFYAYIRPGHGYPNPRLWTTWQALVIAAKWPRWP